MEKAIQSHWFYQRIQITAPVVEVFFELAGGLAFLLRRIHSIQPEYVRTGAPGAYVYTGFPIVGIELTDGTGAIRWQRESIPATLYSAPRTNGGTSTLPPDAAVPPGSINGVIVKAETAPADVLGFGINMSAVFKPRVNTINLFYDIGELIKIRLSGMEMLTPPGYLCPDYIDIAAEGVYL